MSGERASRSSLTLPGRQQQLLEAAVATGKPVVLVLINGRPLDITWASQHVPAILEAWYPGTEGGNAIADLLFGDAVPGGKLPVTWPRNVGQVPIYYARNLTQIPEAPDTRYWDGSSAPLYPFGYGLSYTSFSLGEMKTSAKSVKSGASMTVSIDVAELWQIDRGSGGAALYASALGECVAAGTGAEGISAHHAKAGGTEDGRVEIGYE